MKKNLLVLILFVSGIVNVFAQKMPVLDTNRVRITEKDQTILAQINPVNSSPKVKSGLFYYWYSAGSIHFSQGGFSGKLLNGSYNEYYPDKNLKQQGTFKKGLKDGTWKSWNEDGTLSSATKWKNGLVVSEASPSFWRKINILKRKAKHAPADSLSKPNKSK
jgi:hypothetical protein